MTIWKICVVIFFIDQKSMIDSLQDIRKNMKHFLWNNKILLNPKYPLYINIHWSCHLQCVCFYMKQKC